jgi:WD40 repeat protein
MSTFEVSVANHISDQSTDTIHKGLDALTQAVLQLRSEIDDLERLKHLTTLHVQQCDSDLEHLRIIHRQVKARLEALPSSPVVPPPRPVGYLTTGDTKWSFVPNKTKSNVRLRYSLPVDSVLCTIKFNGDGTFFSFTDGKNVYLVNQADGTIVGTCPIPRPPGQQSELLSRAICFSPDSKFLAVAGPANTTIVIDVRTRRIVASLEMHRNLVSTIAFFRDCRRLLTGGFDGKLCVWSIPEFQLIQMVQHGVDGQTGKDEMIAALAIGADDEYVAVGFMNGTVGLYEPTFSQPMASFQAHSEFLFNVVISKKGIIATASHDKSAKLWVIKGVPSCKHILTGHTDCVLAITFSPKDPVLFTGSKDETIKCWNEATGKLLFTLTGHKNTIFQIDHHPIERTIVSCSGDGLVCVWDYALA